MRFYLGTHQPQWLGRSAVPLFVSASALRRRKTVPRATARWALDSGGFSELSMRGRWTIDARRYAEEVLRWSAMVGPPDFAAIQDWMCEPWILQKTGKTVTDHQALTIESFTTLRELAPEVRWAPVVQGWATEDYVRHVDMYAAAGFDLTTEPIVGVGVGSVCRRQATSQANAIFRRLGLLGLRTHAFGIKSQGMQTFGDWIASADSMAWSFVARRRQIRLPGHTHRNCANCFDFAMRWHDELLTKVENARPAQQELAL